MIENVLPAVAITSAFLISFKIIKIGLKEKAEHEIIEIGLKEKAEHG